MTERGTDTDNHDQIGITHGLQDTMGPRKRTRIAAGSGQKGRREIGGDDDKASGAAFEVPELPPDFDGNPMDGGQYLAMVRQEARRHAPVYRLASDHKWMQQSLAASTKPESLPELPARGALALELPVPQGDKWHTDYTAKFRDLRKRMSSPLTPTPRAKRKVLAAQADMPEDPSNEGLWFAWLHGFLRRDQNSEQRSITGVRRPSMTQLSALEHQDKLFLLESITDWLDNPAAQDSLLRIKCGPDAVAPFVWVTSRGEGIDGRTPSDHEATLPRAIPTHLSLWLFALLASLSPHLDSDETSMLRQLVRAVSQAIKISRERAWSLLEEDAGFGVEPEGNDDEIALLPSKRNQAQSLPMSTESANSLLSDAAPKSAWREHVLAQTRAAEASSWMVIAAVIDVWKQTDLWDEIRSTLNDV